MGIKATSTIDDDRWAKHPYGVEFDDEECNRRFKATSLNHRDQCYQIIRETRAAGYDIDTNINEYFY